MKFAQRAAMGSRMYYLIKLGSAELKSRVAANLRDRLFGTNDPHVLRSYNDVWSLVFSVLRVAEHAKERQRIARDLTRLQQLAIQQTGLDFLRNA